MSASTKLLSSADEPAAENWFHWASRSGLAIFEQGMISGSNFLLNVLLARWLKPEQYGAYALVFSIQVLLLGFYQALLLEPMCVLGASFSPDEFRRYFGSLLQIQVRLCCVVAFLLLLAATLFGYFRPYSQVLAALLGLAVSTPCVLTFWLTRYACYLAQRPQEATRGAFAYTCLVLALLYWLRGGTHLSGLTVFLTVGLSAACVSGFLLVKLRPLFESRVSDQQHWREHWLFGRWEVSKVSFDWISENISYTLTASFLGMAEVGALKAIMTLFLPLTHSMAALKRLLLPYLARISQHRGHDSAATSVWNMVIVYLIGGALYGVLVSILANPLFHLLWGNKYSAFAYLVPWVSIAALFGLPAHAIDMGLRAIRSPRSIFTSSCLAAVAAVAVTLPLTRSFGVRGAVAAIVVSNSILLVILGTVFRRKSATAVSCAESVTSF